MNNLQYQSGFGNEFTSEAEAGTLPVGQNSPQHVAHGLYAELLSGTAFTAPRHENRRTWMYRKHPSVVVGTYTPFPHAFLKTAGVSNNSTAATPPTPPNPMRWSPFWHDKSIESKSEDFIASLRTVATNGDAEAQVGMATHIYATNVDMTAAFVNADGEMLIVPQQGELFIRTELGCMTVAPKEIALIPRGMAFRVSLIKTEVVVENNAEDKGYFTGYICENYGATFRLPELGPIGSNGLANARDFLTPVASFEADAERNIEWFIIKKYGGHLWQAKSANSPFNVVAWHGNLVPYKYDTAHFMAIGSISFDHPDPSIFTVLTSPSDTAGVANCDFVIFPPRWLVAEHTFRPPWFHRNVMSEMMGLLCGEYDAKAGSQKDDNACGKVRSFVPGSISLHNSMVPHGPDAQAFEKASASELLPKKLDNTLAFMFESRLRFQVTAFALNAPQLDANYAQCWGGL